MRKIANTSELQGELRQILAYAQSELPSRAVLASQLRELSLRVAARKKAPPSDEPDEAEMARREKELNERDLKEMEALLKKQRFNPKDAKKLQDEGMGPMELEQRLKRKPGDVGSLEYTHDLKRR